MTSLNDIRTKFLSYFEDTGHEVVASSPLVPRNDATLMFTNSGMVQFKNIFTGLEKRDYTKAVTSQKCVRAGGKHNDLDNVGYTARHHTFFEMLGNFSFGEYFKEQAIYYSWDLIVRELGLDRDKLLCTVYHDDEEAVSYWKKIAGFTDDKIIRIATSDNFWAMGNTGPCGPCSEIFYDYGEGVPGGPPGSPDEDGDRFVEIWNLVFMQFERDDEGKLTPLPKPCIDTGMGLERIGSVLQGKTDNYETDLFRKLIEASADITSTDPDGDGNVHHRVIADHLRAVSFLIAEGVLPSNEGRGYVLRRILRRAIRHVHLLGYQETLINLLVPHLVNEMGAAFPELRQSEAMIAETIKGEEERFRKTLDRGLKLLSSELTKLDTGKLFPGQTAFKLYDTYGFPLDLTQDALREKGLKVDEAGFEAEMAKQKEQARLSWVGSGEIADNKIWYEILDKCGPSEFLGYEMEQAEGQILVITDGTELLSKTGKGSKVQIITNQTPFYAEAGGQVGDKGIIRTETGTAKVYDTRNHLGMIFHYAEITEGEIEPETSAKLEIDTRIRKEVKCNHSATHLLNEALREVLGNHVVQKGSLNDENRLRFDFSHNHQLQLEDITRIEEIVNHYIWQNVPVNTSLMSLDEALELGSQALFGEKYDDEVRVVSMGHSPDSGKGRDQSTFSIELCGGTHVGLTGEIGLFITTGESSISAGVRRIEAITGEKARKYLANHDMIMAEIALALKVQPEHAVHRVLQLQSERNNLKKENERLKRELLTSRQVVSNNGNSSQEKSGSPDQLSGKIGENNYLIRIFHSISPKDLPILMDEEKKQIGQGIVVLLAVFDNKSSVAVGVTKNLEGKYSAVDIVRDIVPLLGGKGGGGRNDFARGGGPRTDDLEYLLPEIEKVIGG